MAERMKYAMDRRAWVQAADEKLPQLRAEAIRAQREACEFWHSIQEWPSAGFNPSAMQKLSSELYRQAIFALNQVLYYEGMRRANVDE